ncbi:hypothetical protein GCM10008995_12870 [Halobellus salinus]|uniref:Uncharacterized protein n=1 Tax=Halobellus salinus TaxID=931585 RepID=A0A830E9J6_9EURY|nr:hypothetical protein GCM10008995_12870 [Halobellus salinus]
MHKPDKALRDYRTGNRSETHDSGRDERGLTARVTSRDGTAGRASARPPTGKRPPMGVLLPLPPDVSRIQ